MSKSTAAVIMTSDAELAPWGDDGWRFSGAMQLVSDGPDWLYAQWPVLDGGEHHGVAPFASLVLRDAPRARAEDIAVMAFAMLQVKEWPLLHPWWDDQNDRAGMRGSPRSTPVSSCSRWWKLVLVGWLSRYWTSCADSDSR